VSAFNGAGGNGLTTGTDYAPFRAAFGSRCDWCFYQRGISESESKVMQDKTTGKKRRLRLTPCGNAARKMPEFQGLSASNGKFCTKRFL
jgi:hypothetical protein